MMIRCREPRSILTQVREWREANPDVSLKMNYDRYREAAAELEVVMGQELLTIMSEVPIPHSVDGLWLMTSATWKALRLTESPDLEVEYCSSLTLYSGVLGYYRGWPICLGPFVPRYGVSYVSNDRRSGAD